MKLPFVKMQGAGNDYIFLDARTRPVPSPARLARAMSRRHFSVGADGIVLLCPSARADVGMRIFNADGSEGETCGNALRCIGRLLFERGECPAHMTVETRAGVRELTVFASEDGRFSVRVCMGRADVSFRTETVDGADCPLFCVSLGNPHAVLFSPPEALRSIVSLGAKIEHLPCFPARTNVELAAMLSEGHFAARVWERGSGETLACGSGASAIAAAAVAKGLCRAGTPVVVRFPGGELTCFIEKDGVCFLEGGAETVFEGVYEDADGSDSGAL